MDRRVDHPDGSNYRRDRAIYVVEYVSRIVGVNVNELL